MFCVQYSSISCRALALFTAVYWAIGATVPCPCSWSTVSMWVEGEITTGEAGRLAASANGCRWKSKTDIKLKIMSGFCNCVYGPTSVPMQIYRAFGERTLDKCAPPNTNNSLPHSTWRVFVCAVRVWDPSHGWNCVCLQWFVFLKVRTIGDWQRDVDSSDSTHLHHSQHQQTHSCERVWVQVYTPVDAFTFLPLNIVVEIF